MTCDAVKEDVLEDIQKDLNNGSAIAVNLRRNTDVATPVNEQKN